MRELERVSEAAQARFAKRKNRGTCGAGVTEG